MYGKDSKFQEKQEKSYHDEKSRADNPGKKNIRFRRGMVMDFSPGNAHVDLETIV